MSRMAEGGLLSSLRRLLGQDKEVSYERFRDGLGNFELFYPKGWKYDEDIAVVDGKYSIAFESPDGLCRFNVSVDAQLEPGMDFGAYAKAELESPSSGIYTPVTKGHFHGMPAYLRDYSFTSGSRGFFGGGVMFFSGKIVYSLTWSGPEGRKGPLSAVFDHMLRTIMVRASYSVSRKALPGAGSIDIARPERRKRRPRAG
jgi:hypothetical protein